MPILFLEHLIEFSDLSIQSLLQIYVSLLDVYCASVGGLETSSDRY